MKDILKRISELEQIITGQDCPKLYIHIIDTKIQIKNINNNKSMEMTADTPAEAVELVEKYIFKKIPEHVIMSSSFDDLFDLYPEARELFEEFIPVLCSCLTVGDYYKSMENLSLRHLILYNHVHTWGSDTISNRNKGIIYSDEDFQKIFDSEAALLFALYDILTKEQYWRENSGEYKPDRPGYSYGNKRYGRGKQCAKCLTRKISRDRLPARHLYNAVESVRVGQVLS